nr:hypothetical protein [Tanacetum cinerariifolium]
MRKLSNKAAKFVEPNPTRCEEMPKRRRGRPPKSKLTKSVLMHKTNKKAKDLYPNINKEVDCDVNLRRESCNISVVNNESMVATVACIPKQLIQLCRPMRLGGLATWDGGNSTWGGRVRGWVLFSRHLHSTSYIIISRQAAAKWQPSIGQPLVTWHPRQHMSTPVNDVQCRSTTPNHRSTVAVYGGDRRSMMAVNDGRRWQTIVDHRRTIVDHRRTTIDHRRTIDNGG